MKHTKHEISWVNVVTWSTIIGIGILMGILLIRMGIRVLY